MSSSIRHGCRALVGLLIGLSACDLVRDGAALPPDAAVPRPEPEGDGGSPIEPTIDGGPSPVYPPPRTDVVAPVGSRDTFDVATWNIRNLGTTALGQQVTDVALVADLIASLDLDVVAVEEVASIAAWNELVARLPEHEGVLSSHTYGDGTYQKIGYLYRAGTVTLGDVALLFSRYPFPRPALKARFTVDDGSHAPLSIDAIAVHLNAGGQASDIESRRQSVPLLEAHIRAQVDGGGEDEVVLLGDFNEVLTTVEGREILAPLLDETRYLFRTRAAADRRDRSHASGRVLDHVVTTAGLSGELGAREATIVHLERTVTGYDDEISDHVPVVISIPLAPR